MNRVTLLLAVALTLTVTGCASFPQVGNGSADEISRLQAENAALRRAYQAQGGDADETAAPAQAGGRRIMPAIPRRDFYVGPPQMIGQLYRPIDGCAGSGRSIEVRNDFEPNHLRVFLDGREVFVGGAMGRLPTLPPGESLFLCVAPGAHKITTIALEPAGLTELPGFLRTGSVRFSSGAYPQRIEFAYADFELSD